MGKMENLKFRVGTNTNYNLLVFKSDLFNQKDLRVIKTKDNLWFIVSDIAKILEYKNIDGLAKNNVQEKNKKAYKDSGFYNSASGLKLFPHSILINEDGIKDIVAKSRNKNKKIK